MSEDSRLMAQIAEALADNIVELPEGILRNVDPETATVLTRETLEKAIEMLKAQTFSYCGSPERPHVVHPRAYEAGGLTTCASCFGPVWLGEPR